MTLHATIVRWLHREPRNFAVIVPQYNIIRQPRPELRQLCRTINSSALPLNPNDFYCVIIIRPIKPDIEI